MLPILPPPQRFVGERHAASNLDLVIDDRKMLHFKIVQSIFYTRTIEFGQGKSFEIIRLFSIWPLCSFTVNKYRIVTLLIAGYI